MPGRNPRQLEICTLSHVVRVTARTCSTTVVPNYHYVHQEVERWGLSIMTSFNGPPPRGGTDDSISSLPSPMSAHHQAKSSEVRERLTAGGRPAQINAAGERSSSNCPKPSSSSTSVHISQQQSADLTGETSSNRQPVSTQGEAVSRGRPAKRASGGDSTELGRPPYEIKRSASAGPIERSRFMRPTAASQGRAGVRSLSPAPVSAASTRRRSPRINPPPPAPLKREISGLRISQTSVGFRVSTPVISPMVGEMGRTLRSGSRLRGTTSKESRVPTKRGGSVSTGRSGTGLSATVEFYPDEAPGWGARDDSQSSLQSHTSTGNAVNNSQLFQALNGDPRREVVVQTMVVLSPDKSTE